MSDFAEEIYRLIELSGAEFIAQLKLVTSRGEFHLVIGETNIFSVGGEKGKDYNNLLNAARKAVELGYKVFILPNPKGKRTADLILEKDGVFKMYDLKTVYGKHSVSNRLEESLGQSNRVLLNLRTNYDTRLLTKDIKSYFDSSPTVLEVLVLKGRKQISVSRFIASSPRFLKVFRKLYEK